MRHALRLAQAAANADEAPVGAVIYDDSGIVGEGENRIRRDNDTTAHAEIVALRDACRRLGNYRLPHCRMAVTLEPCAMCAGAIFLARFAISSSLRRPMIKQAQWEALNHYTLTQNLIIIPTLLAAYMPMKRRRCCIIFLALDDNHLFI